MRPEQSIATARASVMVYDEQNKKWIPAGSSHGLSKVDLYHHFANFSFRVVGRKLQDHEVSINGAILRGLKYNQATPTFHQWRDNKQVYGLNFSSKEEGDKFASAMMRALEVLNSGGQLKIPWPHPEQPDEMKENFYQQQKEVNNFQRRQDMTQQEMFDRDSVSQYSEEQEEEGGEGLYEEYHSENDYYDQQDRIYEDRRAQPLQEQPMSNFNRQGTYGSFRQNRVVPDQHFQQPLPQPHHQDPYGMSRQQVCNPGESHPAPGFFQPRDQPRDRRTFSTQSQASGSSSPGLQQTHSSSNIYQAANNKDDQYRGRTKSASPTSFHPHGQALQLAGPGQHYSDQRYSPQFELQNRISPQSSPNLTVVAPPSIAPPPPPPPPPPPAPPAPPMPPMYATKTSVGGLAEGLQSFKLKSSASSDASSGKESLGSRSGGGMASMMDEMQKTLARRRQKVEAKAEEEEKDDSEKRSETGSNPEVESPVKDVASAKLKLQELFGSPKMNTTASLSKLEVVNGNRGLELVKNKGTTKVGTTTVELEAVKQEILKEMRDEISKAKMEIIDIIREELNRSRNESDA